MVGTLRSIHQALGYGVFLVVLVALVVAWRRRSSGAAFAAGPFSATMILLDVHVTVGIVLYAVGSYWEAVSAPLLAYAHPLLAVAALAVGHVALARARVAGDAAAAHSALMRGLGAAFVLVTLAIGAASV